MTTPFIQVETHGIGQAERDQLTSPYQQQRDFLATLACIWDHNAAILKRHGYLTPSDWTGIPLVQNIIEADAMEAHRLLQACCELWKCVQSKDPFAIANAGIWLGMMTSGNQWDQFKSRIASYPRSEPKQRAHDLFKSRQQWPSAKVFMDEIERQADPYTHLTPYPPPPRLLTHESLRPMV